MHIRIHIHRTHAQPEKWLWDLALALALDCYSMLKYMHTNTHTYTYTGSWTTIHRHIHVEMNCTLNKSDCAKAHSLPILQPHALHACKSCLCVVCVRVRSYSCSYKYSLFVKFVSTLNFTTQYIQYVFEFESNYTHESLDFDI